MNQNQVNVEELKRSGVVKLKGEEMYSIWVKTSCCNLSAEKLRNLARLTERYGRGYLLFTTRQIPIIPFIHLKDVEEARRELNQNGMDLDRCGPRVRNINICYEEKICPEAFLNALSLAEKLDNFFYDPILHKIKIGVAGCRKDCIISRVLCDISFIATENNGHKGYDAYVGGRLGVHPFVGIQMAKGLKEEACVRFVQNYFDLLRAEGKEGERSADLINRLGPEKVKEELSMNLQKESGLHPMTCESRLKKEGGDQVILRVQAICGEVTSKQLRKIADISEKYGPGFVHFAVRGSPEIPCIEQKDLKKIREELEEVHLHLLDDGMDNLQSCFGYYCTESHANPQSLLKKIYKKIEGFHVKRHRIRISASGCPNSCGIAHLNDIGFMGIVEPIVDPASCNGCGLCLPVCKGKSIKIQDEVAIINQEKCQHCGQCIAVCPFDGMRIKRKGFAVLVGGQEGEEVKLGRMIAEFLSEDESARLAEKCLEVLREKKANAAELIEDIGIENFKALIFSSKDGKA